MPVSDNVTQSPEPGRRMLLFRGDVVRFRLYVDDPDAGVGWLRTNIGSAEMTRAEIIAAVDKNESPMHHDWFDIPMARTENGYELTLPLCEVGHFEAKCYFLPRGEQPVWPAGDNTHVNVEPAESVCANTVYNAFIRQFGPNKRQRQKPPVDVDFKKFDAAGYTLIPPSGTFRSFIKELDFIVDELGCRYIQLLPINPTPTTYGRMGRFGSPYASQSFRLVDTALAEFDHKSTPMEQFIELVDAIHSRYARVILDIAINHTGWGARLHEMQPEWLTRDKDGKIEMPGAWGVIWEDLTKLDYSQRDLWRFMAEVFLTWCRRGVDGFRCDAGYMIPKAAWRYIIARVRDQYPDTIFFLEGLGGRISVTRDLLNTGNLNWAYSELFQNYDRGQIHHYMPEAIDISGSDGVMVHFAETHDNPRLASVSTTWAKMRTALCAMFSNHGGFAFANGVEWFATEKINVHDANPLNWGAEVNQVAHIRRLNTILKTHPAFFDNVTPGFVEKKEGPFLAFLRRHSDSGKSILVLVNLDCRHPVQACWDPAFPGGEGEGGGGAGVVFDLISTTPFPFVRKRSGNALTLEPGQVLCLSPEKEDMAWIETAEKARRRVPDRIAGQRLRSKVLDVYRYFNGTVHMGGFDPDGEALRLKADPAGYCRYRDNGGDKAGVVVWQYPADLKRRVMIPPGFFFMVTVPVYFEARLLENDRVIAMEKGIEKDGGGFFALFTPFAAADRHRPLTLVLTLYNGPRSGGYAHETAYLLVLQDPKKAAVRTTVGRNAVMAGPATLLETNRIGGMCRASTWWGHLESKYDALIGANLTPELPDNRWMMLARCRGWIVYQDYSRAIQTDFIRDVSWNGRGVMTWRFWMPTGLGRHITLSAAVEMVVRENRVRIHFHRHLADDADQLADDRPVRLILRPDIEDRSFHETTKAFMGPEESFPKAVSAAADGFVFSPDPDRLLDITMTGAGFVWEPEWQYMVHRPLEATRGMDPHSDLFSPGYLHATLKGGQTLVLDAAAGRAGVGKPERPGLDLSKIPDEAVSGSIPLPDAMLRAMDHFVVERQQLKSVIAGYPWFLDWGRDSLIFCRGLIAAGKTDTARAVVSLFGQFEQNGTLPNMICGDDAANRDTSDAPLWFIAACRDLVEIAGMGDFPDEPCGGSTIRDILFSIVSGYIQGTPNGIKMDPDTGLVYSPSHFTWMDTNYPAGTPRQGYPVEIQALWYAALQFLAKLDAPADFEIPGGIDLQNMAALVARSIESFFYKPETGFLSDCLHCDPGCVPGDAQADDALRPNQLFALTMGAVKDRDVSENILSACSELLVPGGIRSLADRAVDYPLTIRHNGRVLGDPHRPYRGRYQGDEDTDRKPAYHNGTAWTWVFPSFCEAWGMVHGDKGKEAALAWLSSSTELIESGCLGQVPEITDGNFPHTPRGCDAQAWSASELYRVWAWLSRGE